MIEGLFAVAVGYCIAVIFPVPWLSRAILDGWAKGCNFLVSKFKGN